MGFSKSGLGLIVVLAVLAARSLAVAAEAPRPGAALYEAHCAACHDHPEATRAPSKTTLQAMRGQTITYALTEGKMRVQGQGLDAAQRGELVSWLTGSNTAPTENWAAAMACPAGHRVDLKGAATVTTFGFDHDNTRSLTARQAGLTTAQLSSMELAWAIAFPGATTMRAQPAIVGHNLFLPVAEAGAMYAFDVSNPANPCVEWTFQTPNGAPLRTSAAFGAIRGGTPLLVFSGLDSSVYALDARTGKLLWTRRVASYRYSLTTGTPTVTSDRVIVPVAQYEISVAAANSQVCCSNHGYILSLDPKTGAQQWRYDTMEDAKPVRDRGDGKPLLGPSGAPIWNSPLVDETRGLIYFGTGEANSPPTHRNTDALVAIRLADGKEVWSHQATVRDIYLMGCGANPKPEQLNCVTDTVYRDADFGASLILGHLSSGRDLVFAGQKAGTVWAMDPTTGKVVWRRGLGTGGELGGVHWGIAYGRDTVYAPISAVGHSLPGEEVAPDLASGVYAIDGKTGVVRWAFHNTGSCPPAAPGKVSRCERGLGMSTAPALIDGALVEGALDGKLHVLDTRDGHELWMFDTAQAFPTLNGVPGRGGSIDAASITAADGMLYVNSGYGMFGEAGGNLFLAFRPKSR